MRGLGTDHVISGPMKGLEKNAFRENISRWIRHNFVYIGQIQISGALNPNIQIGLENHLCAGPMNNTYILYSTVT